jgi:hypothetical protein
MKYAEFKRRCIERTDEEGYISEGLVLKINGYEVSYLYIDEDEREFIFVDYVGGLNLSNNIYAFEVDENNEYLIEWFVLEQDDVNS